MTSYLLLVLQFVCLSIWVGGTLTVLTIVAPQLFRATTSRHAGEIMAPILRKFGLLFLLSLVILTLSFAVQLVMLSGLAALKLRIVMGMTSLSILLTVYDRYSLAPHLEFLRREVDFETDHEGRKTFRRLHGRSMLLFVANLFLGLSVVMTLIAPIH